MSKKFRSPQEKKRLSLDRDRRNTYGQNDKASRKRIPLAKAASRRALRRKSNSVAAIWEKLSVDAAESRELAPNGKRRRFRKSSDEPLRIVLQKKKAKRVRLQGRKKRAQAAKSALRK